MKHAGRARNAAFRLILIALVLYLLDVALNRFLDGTQHERTRLHTLRVVIRFALQAFGVLLIAFVVFGAPSQTPTVLGLAGPESQVRDHAADLLRIMRDAIGRWISEPPA